MLKPASELSQWIQENEDRYSSYTVEGEQVLAEHLGDVSRPAASAVKVLHLAAVAASEHRGDLRLNQPILVQDWVSYHLGGTDDWAHRAAMSQAGLSADESDMMASRPTVPLVRALIATMKFSDNSAADLLAAMAPDAMRAAIEAVDPTWVAPPLLLEQLLGLFEFGSAKRREELASLVGRSVDRASVAELYRTVPAVRGELRQLFRKLTWEVDFRQRSLWAASTSRASCRQLVGLVQRGYKSETGSTFAKFMPTHRPTGPQVKFGTLPSVVTGVVVDHEADRFGAFQFEGLPEGLFAREAQSGQLREAMVTAVCERTDLSEVLEATPSLVW